MRALLLLSLCFCSVACNRGSGALEDYNAREITLPDGTVVKAEVMMNTADMARGMMFRETLPEGRAMLFIHTNPNRYPYWMYQVRVPLDIIWMDKSRRIVEIVESAPPCTTKASECVNHGGTKEATYVLELPGGYGRKHGVREGEVLRF